MQFSPTTFKQLTSRLRVRYKSRLKKVLRELDQSSHTYQWIEDHWDELENFSPTKWYLLRQLENLAFFLSIPADSSSKDEFTEVDDEVFERWNSTEFADTFLKLLNRGTTVSKATAKTAASMDQHLVSMGNRHILKVTDTNKGYRIQPSLGEYLKSGKVTKMLQTTLHLEGKELVLMTSSIGEMKDFSVKIEVALHLIRKFSPDSWNRFKAFTEVIIPIKQEELVSYSHQDLPGTSMINLYHRDFVDLLDDLLHENGHHHLNYYLNLGKVIEEPLENIYYSPWRSTLRPLRGIYHAYFTFFWAFKLFSQMADSKELDSIWYIFSQKEKEKIYFRAVEEFYMLEYSFADLSWAKKKGLITPIGWDLVKSQHSQLLKYKSKIPLWEKKSGSNMTAIKALKTKLKESSKKYKKKL